MNVKTTTRISAKAQTTQRTVQMKKVPGRAHVTTDIY